MKRGRKPKTKLPFETNEPKEEKHMGDTEPKVVSSDLRDSALTLIARFIILYRITPDELYTAKQLQQALDEIQ
jgi:hypothetical protein